MKKISKFLIYILFMFVILSVNTIDVLASPVNHGYSSSFQNDCVDNKTCILICAYTNTVRYTYANVTPAGYDYYSSYIYYDFEGGGFFVDWLTQETELNLALHHKYFGHNLIQFGHNVKENLSNGQCPEKSYVDVNNFINLNKQVCFDNNDDYCMKTASKAGTTFKGESTIEYDYQTHIKTYFDYWFPTIDYSCDEYRALKIDIKDQFVTDFSNNFLYGYSIPTFIANSSSYKNGLKEVENRISDLKEKCDSEVIDDYNSGLLDDEEKDKLLEENNTANDDLGSQLDDAKKAIVSGTINVPDVKKITSCSSLLGDPNDPDGKDPAYYLSFAFKIIRYIAIIALVILSVMDFITAIASSDDDEVKKAVNKTIKRFVLCVIIFLLPSLISYVLSLIHGYSMDICISTKV